MSCYSGASGSASWVLGISTPDEETHYVSAGTYLCCAMQRSGAAGSGLGAGAVGVGHHWTLLLWLKCERNPRMSPSWPMLQRIALLLSELIYHCRSVKELHRHCLARGVWAKLLIPWKAWLREHGAPAVRSADCPLGMAGISENMRVKV